MCNIAGDLMRIDNLRPTAVHYFHYLNKQKALAPSINFLSFGTLKYCTIYPPQNSLRVLFSSEDMCLSSRVNFWNHNVLEPHLVFYATLPQWSSSMMLKPMQSYFFGEISAGQRVLNICSVFVKQKIYIWTVWCRPLINISVCRCKSATYPNLVASCLSFLQHCI